MKPAMEETFDLQDAFAAAEGHPDSESDMKKKNRNAPDTRVVKQHDHEVIHPTNVLKMRAAVLADGPEIIDEQAVKRAERALDALSHNFTAWMGEEARRLDLARKTALSRVSSDDSRQALYRSAHDIKGQGVTLGFPLAARAAASLCNLLDGLPWSAIDGRLIHQHVDAVLALVREGENPERRQVGEHLARELEGAAAAAIRRHEDEGARVLH
jgi:hypothetical protein